MQLARRAGKKCQLSTKHWRHRLCFSFPGGKLFWRVWSCRHRWTLTGIKTAGQTGCSEEDAKESDIMGDLGKMGFEAGLLVIFVKNMLTTGTLVEVSRVGWKDLTQHECEFFLDITALDGMWCNSHMDSKNKAGGCHNTPLSLGWFYLIVL